MRGDDIVDLYQEDRPAKEPLAATLSIPTIKLEPTLQEHYELLYVKLKKP